MVSSNVSWNISILLFLINLNGFSYAKDANWNAIFGTYHPYLETCKPKTFNVKIVNLNKTELIESQAKIEVVSDSNLVYVSSTIPLDEIKKNSWNGTFLATAIFIGRANLFVEIHRANGEPKTERSTTRMSLKTFRNGVLKSDYAEFYENFEFAFYLVLRLLCGIAINWKKFYKTIRKPIALPVSVVVQFIICPLSSYALSLIIFPDDVDMQVVSSIIGVCLVGGVSNLWTLILGGNFELSIIMSILNTLLVCGATHFWIFILSITIAKEKLFKIDHNYYIGIISYLILPLIVGALLNLCCTCLSRISKIILKFISPVYIFSITFYAICMNYDLLSPNVVVLYTWKMVLAGFLLPILHYAMGWFLGFAFKQYYEDKLAIAVETINKNIPIAMSIATANLNTLQREEAILLSNVVLLMTPVPLLVHFVFNKFRMKKFTIRITTANSLNS